MSVSWWERTKLWLSRQGSLVDLVIGLRAQLMFERGQSREVDAQADRLRGQITKLNAEWRAETVRLRAELAAADEAFRLRLADERRVLEVERRYGNRAVARLRAVDELLGGLPPDLAARFRAHTRPYETAINGDGVQV